MSQNSYPPTVKTPNGPGLLIGRDAAGLYLVRHPIGATIDQSRCQQVQSKTHVNGLLAWYLKVEAK